MDPYFKRLMYVRYADDFVILIIGSKKDAENIKLKIAEVLFVRCKASLNMEKTVITHIRDGFDFLGANIRKLDNRVYKVKSVTKSGKSYARKVPLKLFVTAPISKIIDKLITRGFAKRNHKNKVIPTGIPQLILKDHYSIIQYYNFIIRGLLNFFSFAGNYSSLHRVFWIIRQSAALTLANKFKLKTMKKAFQKFGDDLVDPQTGIKLNIPSSLKVKHKYDSSSTDWESILNVVWKSFTASNFGKPCIICGSTKDVEMHHLRKVADVRNKIRTGNATFRTIQGAYLRKQIPLCRYHHIELHKGNLNYRDIVILVNYNGK